jgi:thiol-disulfide isomerase/thioredoxin
MGVGRAISPRHWSPARRLVVVAVLPLALVVVGLFSYFLVGAISGPSGPVSTQTIGFERLNKPAHPVTMPNLSGHGSTGLANLAGKPIVINFWSTTCVDCVAETRALVQVADATKGRVNFLGIDTLDELGLARAFAVKYHIPYPLTFDPNEVVGTRYGLVGLPMTFFFSPSGKEVLGVNIGAVTARSLTHILHELYGDKA